MRYLIKNASVVSPTEVLENTSVVFDGEKITYVGVCPENTENYTVIDGKGKYVMPGFIETHVHGGGGHDFMDGTFEAFESIVNTHASHGTTSIMPTTVACSEAEMFEFFKLYRSAKDKITSANVLGIHLEGPYISVAMKGAQKECFIRRPSKREIDRLMDEAGDIIARCTMAPEEGEEMIYAGQRMLEKGIDLAIGHSNAIAPQIIEAYEKGFRHITHFNCSTPGTRKINQIVCAGFHEAAYLLDGMTLDLIGDGRHIPKELMQAVLKIKGVDNVILITDAMRAAGTDVKESFLGSKNEGSPVIIEDGVAKLPDRSFYAGSITTADRMIKNAILNYDISICDAVRMLTLSPAKKFRLDDRKGYIKEGYDADIVIMDQSFDIANVFTMGKQIV